MGSEIEKADKEPLTVPPKFKEFARDITARGKIFETELNAACLTGYDLGKAIVDYAESSDVKKTVDAYNLKNKEAHIGGRPIAYHCYVARCMEEHFGLSHRHLEVCARAFIFDRSTGFELGNSLRTKALKGFSPTVGENPPLPMLPLDKMAAPNPTEANEESEPKEPAEEIEANLKILLRVVTDKVLTVHSIASKNPKVFKRLGGEEHFDNLFDEVNAKLKVVGLCIGTIKPQSKERK